MDSVYYFVESVHMFVPVIAVLSCILIIFCCGFRTSQQPSDEYLDKIKTLEDFNRKKKAKDKPKQKATGTSGQPAKPPSDGETEIKQRNVESTKKQQTKPAAKEVVEVPQPVADGSWIEVTAKKTKKSPSTKPPKKEDSITEETSVPSNSPVKTNKGESLVKSSPKVQQKPVAKEPVKTAPIRVEINQPVTTVDTAASSPRSIGKSDETSSVTSHKSFNSSLPEENASSSSTTASSNKTFEKVSAVGLDERTLEELEVEGDDFILVSSNNQAKENDSPKKKNKKKSKLADVDLQPFMEVEKKVEKLPPAPVAKPVETAQIPSTSAPVEAEPANSDGAEDQDGQEEGVPKKRKSKKKKDKKAKGKASGPAEGADKEDGDSDEELPVTSDIPSESDGFVEAQKPRRRVRRDV